MLKRFWWRLKALLTLETTPVEFDGHYYKTTGK